MMRCSKCNKNLAGLRETIVKDIRSDATVLCATSDNVHYHCVGIMKGDKPFCGECNDKEEEQK